MFGLFFSVPGLRCRAWNTLLAALMFCIHLKEAPHEGCAGVSACRSSRARLPGLCSTVCGAGRAQGRALAAFPKPRPCNLVPLLSEELPAAISMWGNSNAALPCPCKNPSVAAVPQPAATPSPWLTLQGARGWLPVPVCSRAGTGRAGFKDLSQKYTSVRHC